MLSPFHPVFLDDVIHHLPRLGDLVRGILGQLEKVSRFFFNAVVIIITIINFSGGKRFAHPDFVPSLPQLQEVVGGERVPVQVQVLLRQLEDAASSTRGGEECRIVRKKDVLVVAYRKTRTLQPSAHTCSGMYLISSSVVAGFGRSDSSTGRKQDIQYIKSAGRAVRVRVFPSLLTDGDEVVVIQHVLDFVRRIQDGSSCRATDVADDLEEDQEGEEKGWRINTT